MNVLSQCVGNLKNKVQNLESRALRRALELRQHDLRLTDRAISSATVRPSDVT